MVVEYGMDVGIGGSGMVAMMAMIETEVQKNEGMGG